MGRKLICMLGLCMALTAATAMGQANVPTTQRSSAPAIEDALMPAGPFNGVSLADFLTFLKDTIPGFNSVLIRAPGAPPDYPTFDNLSLKNVTLGQFLDMLRTSYPGVYVQRIYGRIDPLYVIQIGPMPGTKPPDAIANDASPTVKVYSLQGIVSALADSGDSKKALNDVLSLLQAALDQQGGKDQAVLKVHEPTMMLIFKGSPAQMAVLEQALSAMEPSVDAATARLKLEFASEMTKVAKLRKQDQDTIADLSKRLDDFGAQIPSLEKQVAGLKARLDAANATGTTKG
jgi:hypothetical protein